MLKYITQPYKHQERMTEFALQHPFFALFSEPGTGKTKAAIDAARNRAYEIYIAYHRPVKILVTAPNSVLSNWEHEITMHCPKAAALILRGAKASRLKLLNKPLKVDLCFYIINYEGVRVLAEELEEAHFDMVIADESTRIKNAAALQTKALMKVSRRVPYRAILSGTPITQDASDIFSQYKFLDTGETFGSSFLAFRNKYFEPALICCPQNHAVGQYAIQHLPKDLGYSIYCKKCSTYYLISQCPRGHSIKSPIDFTSGKNCWRFWCEWCKATYEIPTFEFIYAEDYEDGRESRIWKWKLKPGAFSELSEKIYRKAIRFTKEQCLDLPPKIYQVREVELNAEEKRLYNEMNAVLKTEFLQKKVTAQIILTKLLRLAQIVSGYVKDENGIEHEIKSCSKLKEFSFLLDEISGQAIIFCEFRQNIKAIAELLKRREESYVTFYGDTPQQERDRAISDFQKGEARFFIAQISTGGFGITLTAASTVIYYSMGFSVEQRVQSEDRAHRLGQTKSVTYIDLVVKNSIDETILSAIKSNKKIADAIIEWWRK